MSDATTTRQPPRTIVLASKRCSTCGHDKLRRDFYARRASSDGLQASCKACHAEADKERAEDRRIPRVKGGCTQCGSAHHVAVYHSVPGAVS